MVSKIALAFVAFVSVASAAIIAERQASVCTLWESVRDDLVANRFDGGECGEEAHESIRLSFHDAIGISKSGKGAGGGADGSIITFSSIEEQDPDNLGTDAAVEDMRTFATKWNVTFGDIIQFAGAVALSGCPGAPRVPVFVGRPPATVAAALGLVPAPTDSVATLVARFADVGLTANEMIALLASHSVAAQDHVDESVAGSPFDSTPGIFDTQFFVETQLRGVTLPGAGGAHPGEVEAPLAGEMRLQSDHNLARDSSTACEWQSFVNNQAKMQSAFSAAMVKMGLLGQVQSKLTDCSSVIPVPPAFNRAASFPAGKTHADVEQACATTPFPTLASDPGAQTSVAPVPPS